jgi:hypothetical protein
MCRTSFGPWYLRDTPWLKLCVLQRDAKGERAEKGGKQAGKPKGTRREPTQQHRLVEIRFQPVAEFSDGM